MQLKSLEELAATNTARHSKDFVGAGLYLLKAGGSMHQAAEMASFANPRIAAVLKAAVEGGNITGWAANLVQTEAAIGRSC